MKRKLFCEISPLTYRISVEKNIFMRRLSDLFNRKVRYASDKSGEPLPIRLYSHRSLIRRRLGNVDMRLQENKAVNLSIAAPKVTGILIKPGETFSFWRLVGRDSKRRGYLEGLTIANGKTSSGTGGGMCQFTNLIHWMVLHSELTITEHHHHDGFDLFPDFGRQIPFGTGTSVMYNYLDYRVRNDTDRVYQLLASTDGEYLCGELRADKPQNFKYHIKAEDERFVREDGAVYRCGKVIRTTVDCDSENIVCTEVIRENHAMVMYDTDLIEVLEN
ncbi:MAG: VanW family protein [Ruminococcaceae bacterium]|nr:VanW family protein [Oscillospiraceae bacterium]